MCVGMPMRVVQRDGHLARCEVNGAEHTVSLFLLQNEMVEPGDHVMVHVGYAIQKLSQAEAEKVWDALRQALAALDAPDA
ncbi:MAG: HypC/HybG/HupF family hydrogenase formation chaperone [Alphaproteobacteria bacterium]|nr:HypC/HybG/HupF family hydrogenase formation chaperone [Alphaproteobacteria bacterium]